MNRREYLRNLSMLGLLPLTGNLVMMADPIAKRKIPATGELLPVIGLGTWQTFDVGRADADRAPLREVLTSLVSHGGSVIDSSPMYNRSENVVGDLTTALGINKKIFMATKVWTNGAEQGMAQMHNSFTLLRRETIDLMQIHNLLDWETHLRTLYAWKEQEKVRYIGITHYTASAHERMQAIITKEKIDFIQVNYNILDRHAENTLLPAAAEQNVAVIINRPFQEGELFERVRGKQLPSWAKDIDCHSWAQFFLKFILSHPAVTCVIPGTSKPHHMVDNLGAGMGRIPDQQQRLEMLKVVGA